MSCPPATLQLAWWRCFNFRYNKMNTSTSRMTTKVPTIAREMIYFCSMPCRSVVAFSLVSASENWKTHCQERLLYQPSQYLQLQLLPFDVRLKIVQFGGKVEGSIVKLFVHILINTRKYPSTRDTFWRMGETFSEPFKWDKWVINRQLYWYYTCIIFCLWGNLTIDLSQGHIWNSTKDNQT